MWETGIFKRLPLLCFQARILGAEGHLSPGESWCALARGVGVKWAEQESWKANEEDTVAFEDHK